MVSRVMLGTDMLENTSVRCIFDHFYDGTKGHAGHGYAVKHNVFLVILYDGLKGHAGHGNAVDQRKNALRQRLDKGLRQPP